MARPRQPRCPLVDAFIAEFKTTNIATSANTCRPHRMGRACTSYGVDRFIRPPNVSLRWLLVEVF